MSDMALPTVELAEHLSIELTGAFFISRLLIKLYEHKKKAKQKQPLYAIRIHMFV